MYHECLQIMLAYAQIVVGQLMTVGHLVTPHRAVTADEGCGYQSDYQQDLGYQSPPLQEVCEFFFRGVTYKRQNLCVYGSSVCSTDSRWQHCLLHQHFIFTPLRPLSQELLSPKFSPSAENLQAAMIKA